MENTTILNEYYKKVMYKYDSPNTFFYLDPPYEKSDGLYIHDTVSINELYDILSKIKGFFLLSYNNSPIAKKLFKDYRIRILNTKYGKGTEGGQNIKKKELSISNF